MNPKQLSEALNIEHETATRIVGLITGRVDYKVHPAVIKWAEKCYHDPRDNANSRAECIMEAINAELQGYGIESIVGRYVDRYHQNVQAIYVNMGDTYNTTILHDNEKGKFIFTSWGDWAERNSTRRKLV